MRSRWFLCLLLLLTACDPGPASIIIETPQASVTPYSTPAATPPVQVTSAAGVTEPALKVNINTADAAALERLPRIGATLADRIITYRHQNGPFRQIEDIRNVAGIGDATFDAIKALITVE
ncbi:MAG: helix-hairpin-helix domain-containing protein [Chloroflexi bacterium]|nr:helix-hairpin-helix domain-containing protein [Chloroflexota bacterium]MCL5273661.1 helix-hairpin-helix domain-containing protein [Chloroflexota bacterium]